jgi:hypothetical protein
MIWEKALLQKERKTIHTTLDAEDAVEDHTM